MKKGTTMSSVAERVQPHGFPYELDAASQFWTLLMGQLSNGQVAVVVFGRDGEVLLGYHDDKEAKKLAPMVRRKRGVDGVVVIRNSGRMTRY